MEEQRENQASEENKEENKAEGTTKEEEKENKSKEDVPEVKKPAKEKVKGTRINKIVLNGFKSFAKHTELLFNGNFNCVLGPNGSGKSNVLDAICFVLGKSSAKSLRAEKSANLIYNGGKSKKPSKTGEVSIFFDNENKTFPTEDKEVKITRIVRQNGQSVYKINDQTRTRQEIIDLLSIAKINPDGYNIILQGDIVKFVEMHPNLRRELIGEIAGISVYEEKKHKAILELDKVDEKLKETEIVLAERNTYLKELKKDRDQALKYKDMSDKIKINKASYLKLRIDKKENEKNELNKKLEESKNDIGKVNEKINALKDQNRQKREEINRIRQDIEEKGDIEQKQLNNDVSNLKIQVGEKRARVGAVKNEINKIAHRIGELKKGIEETDLKIKELEADKQEMQKDIDAKKNEKTLTEQKIAKFKDKNDLSDVADIENKVEEIDKKADEPLLSATSPSKVTYFAFPMPKALAVSILSTTTASANTNSKIFLNLSSKETKSIAKPWLPLSFDIFFISILVGFGLILFKGKNVTTPNLFSFRYLMHSEAVLSSSTTTFLILGPAAISRAKEYFESTFPSSATVP